MKTLFKTSRGQEDADESGKGFNLEKLISDLEEIDHHIY